MKYQVVHYEAYLVLPEGESSNTADTWAFEPFSNTDIPCIFENQEWVRGKRNARKKAYAKARELSKEAERR